MLNPAAGRGAQEAWQATLSLSRVQSTSFPAGCLGGFVGRHWSKVSSGHHRREAVGKCLLTGVVHVMYNGRQDQRQRLQRREHSLQAAHTGRGEAVFK